jgi:hypothetical protein
VFRSSLLYVWVTRGPFGRRTKSLCDSGVIDSPSVSGGVPRGGVRMSCLNVLRVFDQLFDVCMYSLWSPLNIPGAETNCSWVSFRVIHTCSPANHSCEKELT